MKKLEKQGKKFKREAKRVLAQGHDILQTAGNSLQQTQQMQALQLTQAQQAQQLAEAQARIAQLELEAARARVAQLEAAQRATPPAYAAQPEPDADIVFVENQQGSAANTPVMRNY